MPNWMESMASEVPGKLSICTNCGHADVVKLIMIY